MAEKVPPSWLSTMKSSMMLPAYTVVIGSAKGELVPLVLVMVPKGLAVLTLSYRTTPEPQPQVPPARLKLNV
jgi:hypothetical protein